VTVPTVRDAMSTSLVTVGPHAKLREVHACLADGRIRHLPVVDEGGRVIGMITHRDLTSRALGPISWLGHDEVERQLDEIEAGETMTTPVVTVAPDVPLDEAARRMLDAPVDALPVVEGGRLVGLLTEGDFVRIAAGRKTVGG
jgi:CBS domain-containing protein